MKSLKLPKTVIRGSKSAIQTDNTIAKRKGQTNEPASIGRISRLCYNCDTRNVTLVKHPVKSHEIEQKYGYVFLVEKLSHLIDL